MGGFVVEGTPLVTVAGLTEVDQAATSAINAAYVISRQRTVQEDATFGIRQIVDIALKALSPGINDSTTAVMCVDYLTEILGRLASRRIEKPHLLDQGVIRVITQGPTFESLLAQAFDQIRQSAEGNVSVLIRILGALKTVAGMTSSSVRLRAIHDYVRYVDEVAERTIAAPHDRDRFRERLAQVCEAITPPSTVQNA